MFEERNATHFPELMYWFSITFSTWQCSLRSHLRYLFLLLLHFTERRDMISLFWLMTFGTHSNIIVGLLCYFLKTKLSWIFCQMSFKRYYRDLPSCLPVVLNSNKVKQRIPENFQSSNSFTDIELRCCSYLRVNWILATTLNEWVHSIWV